MNNLGYSLEDVSIAGHKGALSFKTQNFVDKGLKVSAAISGGSTEDSASEFFNSSPYITPGVKAIFLLWRMKYFFYKWMKETEKAAKGIKTEIRTQITRLESCTSNKEYTEMCQKAWAKIGDLTKHVFENENYKHLKTLCETAKKSNIEGWGDVLQALDLMRQKSEATIQDAIEKEVSSADSEYQQELDEALKGALSKWVSENWDNLKSICKTYGGGTLTLQKWPTEPTYNKVAKMNYVKGDLYMPVEKIKEYFGSTETIKGLIEKEQEKIDNDTKEYQRNDEAHSSSKDEGTKKTVTTNIKTPDGKSITTREHSKE